MAMGKGIRAALIFAVSFMLFIGLIAFIKVLVVGIEPQTEAVGIVEVKGFIADSKDTIRKIKEFKDDDNILAVVLRVDSPGGVVAASQEIFEELKKLSEEKIVVTSMGNIAASGGYLISCGTEYIFANPGTTTGSIGVILEILNLKEAFDSLGIKGVVLKSGEFKDIGNPLREMTPEEEALLMDYIDNIYRQFIRVIVEERGISEEEVLRIADGRIFSGEQALEHGLVDELGNLEDAIDKAAEMAGIEGEPRVVYPETEGYSLLNLLFGELKGLIIQEVIDNSFKAEYRLEP